MSSIGVEAMHEAIRLELLARVEEVSPRIWASTGLGEIGRRLGGVDSAGNRQ
jgi:hypothetical protein